MALRLSLAEAESAAAQQAAAEAAALEAALRASAAETPVGDLLGELAQPPTLQEELASVLGAAPAPAPAPATVADEPAGAEGSAVLEHSSNFC